MTDLTGFKHGVNLGGWYSQCNHTQERYDNFIVEKDIENIKNWGLDHIRVPVDYNLVETDDGQYKEDGFDRIQKIIDWSNKYGLKMVLDLHKTAGFSFDVGERENGFFENEDLQERFYKLWEQFSTRYAKYENMLMFELLNEVTDQKLSKKWNEIVRNCITRIRKIAPTIRILVGSYWNNAVSAVKDLDAPYDENIVYNFHCYEPIIYTHQGALWVSKKMPPDFRISVNATYRQMADASTKIMDWPENRFEEFGFDNQLSPVYFETLFKEALDVAKERNVTLYCGEYGVIDYGTPEETLYWYKQICSVLDKYDIGRAAWTYKGMNFGLCEPRLDSVRDQLVKIM